MCPQTDIHHQLLWDDSEDPVADEVESNAPRIKTTTGLIILCLNLNVDPPGVQRPPRAASIHGWTETVTLATTESTGIQPRDEAKKATMQRIGDTIQQQYASMWHGRAPRLRCLLDPTVDELLRAASGLVVGNAVKPVCMATSSSSTSRTETSSPKTGLRKRERTTPRIRDEAGEEDPCSNADCQKDVSRSRLLIHYNGQGMPVITTDGELWAFNATFTQYVPVALSRVIPRLMPTIWVLDTPWSNRLIPALSAIGPTSGDGQALMLGAGAGYASLHGHPEMPADIFTTILTTPIRAALHWISCRNVVSDRCGNAGFSVGSSSAPAAAGNADQSQDPTDRRLAALLAAITDTIAWEVLPAPLFKRLFRRDVVVAGLFRNFLLALRMLNWQGTGGRLGSPCSMPPLPAEAIIRHPLWGLWETVLTREYLGVPSMTSGIPPMRYGALSKRLYREDGYTIAMKQDGCALFFAAQMQELSIWIKMMLEERARLLAAYLLYPEAKSLSENIKEHSIELKNVHGVDQKGGIVACELLPIVSPTLSIQGYSLSLQPSKALSHRLEQLLDVTAPPWPPLLYTRMHGKAIEALPGYSPKRRRDYLPILLQALLLGPELRLRALHLISAYMMISDRCVREAVAVGLFPLITRLTTASTKGIDPSLGERVLLIQIWARLVKISPALVADEGVFAALMHAHCDINPYPQPSSRRNTIEPSSSVAISMPNPQEDHFPGDSLAWLLMIGIMQLRHLLPPPCPCRYSAIASTGLSVYGVIWLLFAAAIASSHCEYCKKKRAPALFVQIGLWFNSVPETDESKVLFTTVNALASTLDIAFNFCPPLAITTGMPPGILLAPAYASDALGLQRLRQTRSLWTLAGIAADLFFDSRYTVPLSIVNPRDLRLAHKT
ncbi:hypothetical protein MDAP_002522 [Mitosporidium daphniae]|uniref:Raptor N-terminal CASPase-like domain-containing protein n=1 Tax=Mitosporidium daphniae TaxID=1485682 RepID=A0A098VN11_9MICR|nr:uncharacterized protein DI09_6p410 [Mitosporidium daphniae]KGG50457.1 hypothetical protein DI09_6p410 [Mitosporidium daphniae]|eukprot:XP_013236884.1 uncharacterized protein DI09_6p410 [Mitosporidium daphniae]